MSELSIQRDRTLSLERYQKATKSEKQAGVSQTRSKTVNTAQTVVSENLQRLAAKMKLDSLSPASRRLLQTGESSLAEVEDSLERMAKLLQQATDGSGDVQAQLKELAGEIDRMLQSATSGGARLFQADDAQEAYDELTRDLEELVNTVVESASTGETSESGSTAQTVPRWILNALSQETPSRSQLLSALGLDQSASALDILNAVTSHELGTNFATDYLASLYLGSIISGGDGTDGNAALNGLQQLLEKVAGGATMDEALQELTGGEITSLMDLEGIFADGSQDLMGFLGDFLLTGGDLSSLALGDYAAMALLTGMEGFDLDLLLGLLTALQDASASAAGTDGTAAMAETAEGAAQSTQQFGNFLVSGENLSGVTFDPSSGILTISGSGDVTVLGAVQTGQAPLEGQGIVLTGSGNVTLQNVEASTLTVNVSNVRLISMGENILNAIRLGRGTALTLDGEGHLRVGILQGGRSNTLTVSGGAVTVDDGKGDLSGLGSVILDGGASLAARAGSVYSETGQAKKALDLVWKTLLPGWSGLTGVEVDGKEAKMALWSQSDQARLWLEKGVDSSHGYPVHTVALTGRDETDHISTRYTYLQWDDRKGRFVEVVKYPNPFTVSGGEPGGDWIYDEPTQTLHILTDQVDGVSGGVGVDAEDAPFSGRIALENNIGSVTLALGGVQCKALAGKALDLGRENDVTLFLNSGTENSLESGRGYAGVSLGDGSCLTIDVPDAEGEQDKDAAPGSLYAVGGDGGAGIGRDSGGSWDRVSRITIRGGVVTAVGGGAGAGIGAGKHGFMGDVTITGGKVSATGGKTGGAGIGGALGAPVGDINIEGGEITAVATYHAAAIGAGIEGECGDVHIGARARIIKAQGGDPGMDIGPCRFGRSGQVQVDDNSDQVAVSSTSGGVPLRIGGETVSLPQYRLSAQNLLLNSLNVTDWDSAWAAKGVVNAAMRRVSRIRAAYGTLYEQAEREGASSADTLLNKTKRSLLQGTSLAMRTHSTPNLDEVSNLLE